MSTHLAPKTDSNQPAVYQIRVEGQLDCSWADWFGGMTIVLQANGDTVLTGAVVDQAALYGVLKQVRDLGMTLVSVNRVNPHTPDSSSENLPSPIGRGAGGEGFFSKDSSIAESSQAEMVRYQFAPQN